MWAAYEAQLLSAETNHQLFPQGSFRISSNVHLTVLRADGSATGRLGRCRLDQVSYLLGRAKNLRRDIFLVHLLNSVRKHRLDFTLSFLSKAQ